MPLKRNTAQLRSAKQIIEILDAEGFTPKVAGMLQRWYRHYASGQRVRALDVVKRRWNEAAKSPPLTEEQKQALGRLINHLVEIGFVSGVRMTLAARVAAGTKADG